MRILCLANSVKQGGRCLAGIQLNNNNHPVIQNNRPVWVRPVVKSEHGQLPGFLCSKIAPLNVIEIEQAAINGTGYQSENTTFKDNSLKVIGSVNPSVLEKLCDNDSLRIVFGNRGKAIPKDKIHRMNHSLMLIKTSIFQITERKNRYRDNPQIRLTFRYHGNLYDLPITDPLFLLQYEKDSTILDQKEEIFVVLSLGISFQDWYYKIAASIIY